MKLKIILPAALLPVLIYSSSYFPQFYHIYRPELGEWSKYEMVDAMGQKALLTISVVSKEKEAFWIEVESVMDGETGLASFLAAGDPTEDSNVLKVRLKSGDGPIIEIEKKTLEKLKSSQQNLSPPFGIGPSKGKLQGLPNETLKIGAKNYDCTKMRLVSPEGASADVWLSEDVTPFGVVKLTSGGESLTLIEAGQGAKAKLTGAATPLVLEGD